MPRLTKRMVQAIQPRTNEFFVWDDSLPGFGLRVYPSGQCSYCIQYKMHGRTRRIALGRVEVLTPEQARRRAKELLSQAVLGADPASGRARERNAPTVGELSKRFLTDYVEVSNKPRAVKESRRILGKYIVPRLGARKVKGLQRSDIEQFRNELRDTPFQANRALSALSKMLDLAESWGMRTKGTNPCRGVSRFPEPKRERFLSDAEFARLGRALSVVEQQSPQWQGASPGRPSADAHGGSEVRDPDLGVGLHPLGAAGDPAAGLKDGARSVPLHAPALQVLQGLWEARRSGRWVIPSLSREGPQRSIDEPWKAIREAAGLKLRLHDLRHSYASAGARAGVSLPLIGAVLGHSQASTTARYTHLDSQPAHEATARVGARISAALDRDSQAEVLEFGERGASGSVCFSGDPYVDWNLE